MAGNWFGFLPGIKLHQLRGTTRALTGHKHDRTGLSPSGSTKLCQLVKLSVCMFNAFLFSNFMKKLSIAPFGLHLMRDYFQGQLLILIKAIH